jgi:voltage-gated potassium channel
MTAVVGGRRVALRTRVGRLRAAHSYRVVLLLIAAVFVFASVAGDAGWTSSILLLLAAATLATAIWTSGLGSLHSRAVIAVLAAAAALAVAVLIWDKADMAAAAAVATAVLFLATIVAIAIGVVDQNEVNAQSVTGAVCIYLLFGIVFVFVYGSMAVLGSGDFFAQGTDGTRALRLYFSYVTLATLGYGDYTPAGNLGHSPAVVEALLGQLYLVTVLALRVSRMRGRRED